VISLLSSGIHPDIALSLDSAERLAFLVVLGEQNGREFDWKKLEWIKKS